MLGRASLQVVLVRASRGSEVQLSLIQTARYETENALRAGIEDPGSVKVMVHP